MSKLSNQLNKLLEQQIDGDELAQHILKALIKKALKGDMQAINTVLDRMLGKPTQNMEISGKDNNAIQFDSINALQAIDERFAKLVAAGKNSDDAISDKD